MKNERKATAEAIAMSKAAQNKTNLVMAEEIAEIMPQAKEHVANLTEIYKEKALNRSNDIMSVVSTARKSILVELKSGEFVPYNSETDLGELGLVTPWRALKQVSIDDR